MSVAPITPIAPATGAPGPSSSVASPGNAFQNVFSQLIQGANQHQVAADQQIQQLASGETDSVHNVVMSVAKADLSFRLVLEIRNRLIESYQEIMRMQV